MDQIQNKSQAGSATPGNMGATGRPVSVKKYPPRMGQRPPIQQPKRGMSNQKMAQMNKVGKASMNKKTEDDVRSEKAVSILNKIVSICIFMLFFGLPLFFLDMTYQGISFEKQYYFYFWTFIGVIAWASSGVLGGKISIRRTSLDIPLGVLWIVYILATIFSVDKYHSFFGFFGNPINGLMSLTALILAYYLIVSFVSKDRVKTMWWAIVISGGIVTFWSFLATMRFIPQEVLQYIVPSLTGTFTSLAAFLAMMLPLFIVSGSLIDKTKSKVKANIIIATLFIITVLNLITLSLLFGYVRWYIVIAAIALLLVFVISKFVKVSQTTSAMTVFVFLTLVLFFIYGQPIFTRTAIQPEASLNYGLSFDIVKEAVKSKPILGSGPGTYGYNFSLYRPQELNKSGQYDIRFFSDRGVLLESISTVGVIGAIALIVVCLTYISTIIHAFSKSKDENTKTIALGLFVTSVMAFTYALFWSMDGIIVLYGVLVAALSIGLLREGTGEDDAKLELSMSSTPQNALSFAFLAILIAVGAIFGFVTLGKMFVADIHAGNALKARAQSNFEESSKSFMQAVGLNGQEGRYFTIISQYGLDLANIELAKGEDADKDKVLNFVNSATGAATEGRNLMPNDVLANETAGFIYENSGGYVNGALTLATSAYNRARELEPQNPYLDIAVGKLKLMEAQALGEDAVEEKNALIEEAKALFEESKDKTTFDYDGQEVSTFAPSYYYIAITEEALGNTDEAIVAMTTALQVAQLDRSLSQQQLLSRQINYGFNLARLLQARGTDEDNKNAESLLLQIIGVNDQEINSHLNLALLYEQTDRSDEAIVEYKKILEILPEDDEKARENIQGLIDTIEQGGSNVNIGDNQGEENIDEKVGANESEEMPVVENEKVSILVLSGNNSEEGANEGESILKEAGYDASVRNEDRDLDGVVIMYGSDVDKGEIDSMKQILQARFPNITAERNDEEVTTYNHKVVIAIGSTATSDNSDEQMNEDDVVEPVPEDVPTEE